MPEGRSRRQKAFLVFLIIIVPILLFLGWSQASFNLTFIHPQTASETILLVTLSGTIFLSFLIFSLILARLLLRLYFERRQEKLGSHFKTKMVVLFLALSFVPTVFLYIFAYGLINRSIDKWFAAPLDAVRKDTSYIVNRLESQMEDRARGITARLARSQRLIALVEQGNDAEIASLLRSQPLHSGSESLLCFDASGSPIAAAGTRSMGPSLVQMWFGAGGISRLAPEGVSLKRQVGRQTYFLSARGLATRDGVSVGSIVAIAQMPSDLSRASAEISSETRKYDELSSQLKAIKKLDVMFLGLVTLLILFVAAWLALFIAKQVTVPIHALAAATEEIAHGHLDHRITVRTDDELGTLIRSFNAMIQQLQENRLAIERASSELEAANRGLEERGNTMETILENIPTGVVSFDPEGEILRINSTAERMFGAERAQAARTLNDLLAPEEAREAARLFRRATRQGVLTRQMELTLAGRRANVAVTVSSIHARHGAVGTLLVLEDLTELVRAQKAAAWQEVAQRLAHEIKNPLTPISLSAERIRRWMDRGAAQPGSQEFRAALVESSRLISNEVEALQKLVDEFSAFARFPVSHPEPCELNHVVARALDIFDGRLQGVRIHTEFAANLPLVQADPDQMKRVVVNLIDNAAEAMEASPVKEIWVSTALDPDRDIVELIVADSGPGISLEAKERLFLPYFSTKERGTGLGLAIVSRIISEHHGTIRVEENRPVGTRFVIELPAERVTATATVS